MGPVTLTGGLVVRAYRHDDAVRIHDAVDATRARLARWMPWVPHTTTVAAYRAFIEEARRREEDGVAVHRGIFDGDAAVGGLGATIDLVNREAEVGYWISPQWEGRGAVSAAVTALLDHLFEDFGLHRVVIRAAVANLRSRALAERLGFTQEGVLREALVLEGRSVDAALYSLLEDEWRERRP